MSNDRKASVVIAIQAMTITFLVAPLLTAAPAHAQLSAAQKCAIAKEKAAAKKAADKIKCYKKTKFAAAVAPACLQKAEGTFAKAFAKAEAPGGCHHPRSAPVVS